MSDSPEASPVHPLPSSQMWGALARDGWALLTDERALPEALADPWGYAERLCGERARMVERQFIRPTPQGRTFAGGMHDTPLHTDSQMYLGAAARLQVMVCERAARQGGESTLLDTRALLERVKEADPALHEALYRETRRMRFYFGDVVGPTVSPEGAFTHPPLPDSADAIGTRLLAILKRIPVVEVHPRPGDVLVVDNHRVLHGRRAFDDAARSFVRLLIWPGPFRGEAERRFRAVVDLMRGVSPSRVAAREKVSEAELYRWRDEVARVRE